MMVSVGYEDDIDTALEGGEFTLERTLILRKHKINWWRVLGGRFANLDMLRLWDHAIVFVETGYSNES